MAVCDELSGIFSIKLLPLGLHIRPARTTLNRAFIEGDSRPFHRANDVLYGAFNVAGAVRIFNAKDIHAAVMPREEIAIERRPERTNMDETGGRRSETYANQG